MLVHALVTSIWTNPEPSILAILDGLDKVLADLVGGGALVALLAQDDAPQLLLVPVGRRLRLLLVLVLLASLRYISDAAYIVHMATADGGAYRSVLAASFLSFF